MNEELRYLGNLLYDTKSKFEFNQYSSIFNFTTENLSGYMSKIDLENKELLVPCASGDHAFEAILNGSSCVDFFDINYYSKYIVMLKKAAIKTLSNEEFIQFFLKTKNAYNKNLYFNKIRNKLEDDAKNFWDYCISSHKDSMLLRKSALFLHDDYNENTIKCVLDYIKKDNYDILKNKIELLDDSNYYIGNVIDIPRMIEKKYDVILLSNIQDYMSSTYNTDYLTALKKYRNFIKNDLMKNINDNGFIVSEYYYNNSAVPGLSPGDSDRQIKFDSVYDILGMSFHESPDQVKIYDKKRNFN